MRNQFFGDFNDYWKYGFLRALASQGLRVGVCWMLTPDDGAHGEKRQYLAKPAEWRQYDPDLYDILQKLNEPTTPRSVQLCAEHSIIPTATYFSETVPHSGRDAFLDRALSALQACAIVFFDPDNGIEVESVSHGSWKAMKYVFWSELKEAYSRGHSLVVYQHIQQVDRRRKVAELPEAHRCNQTDQHRRHQD